MAVDYARVVFGKVSASIDLYGKIRTYSDIAKAAAIDHLGKSAAAEIPAGALSLRGPVAFTDDMTDSVFVALRGMGTVSLGQVIDPKRVTGGAWFLLEIDSARDVSGMLVTSGVRACSSPMLDHLFLTLFACSPRRSGTWRSGSRPNRVSKR